MVVYVAFIAILNLALGYGLAVYIGAGRKKAVTDANEEASYSDEDEYESDDSYADAEEDEYETATS